MILVRIMLGVAAVAATVAVVYAAIGVVVGHNVFTEGWNDGKPRRH